MWLKYRPHVCFFLTLSQDRARSIPLAQPEACPQRSERPVCACSPHRSRNGYPGWYRYMHDQIGRNPLKSGNITKCCPGNQMSWVLSKQGRQRVKTTIGRFGWRLNLYQWSSFDEIWRFSSKSRNFATTLGIDSPGSSAGRLETKG